MKRWKVETQGVKLDFTVVHPENNMYLFECTASVGESHLTATVFRDGVVLNQIGALLTNEKDIENFMNLQATLLITIESMIEEFVKHKDVQAVNKIKAKAEYGEIH